jgi:1-deoxy-D-xylulose-5-phosphate synthase
MHPLLSKLDSADKLREMTPAELTAVAAEIRDVLCNLLATRTAHFASNLGVVELCLALHSVFDFRTDRLIWDTGHQVYPHKLITGRYRQFSTIRTRGGLMGYPNPHESPYDLFMTGHAGCSVSTALGLKVGDYLAGQGQRKSIAVIGDGAFPSGIVFEAMNNAGELNKDLIVILNDNKMSICPRVGAVASYLDRLRNAPFYSGLKSEVTRMLSKVPVFGDPTERFLAQIKEAVKAGLIQGSLFEELGFKYFGPIDGHDIVLLRKYLSMVRDQAAPVLLHVVTEKGHGYKPAAEDPVYFHTPPSFIDRDGRPVSAAKQESPAYTNFARDAIGNAMRADPRVAVITAAMCQGNKLEPVRSEFPERFFDVGICESHAVAFAAGQCKAGMRPIVDIYSTFLQRSFDQIFQEVSLQNLPVVFMMDRSGLTGPDGPTHHGTYDIGYMRLFPNMIVMAPALGAEVQLMLDFALKQNSPTAIRYPKTSALSYDGNVEPIRLGRSQTMRQGIDGTIITYGTMLEQALEAAELLSAEGVEVTVVNARFVKPLDQEMLLRAWDQGRFVVTVEEGALMTGFGSAVLEAANQLNLDTRRLRRLGIPDVYVEHGERADLLESLGLDAQGIARTCLDLSTHFEAAGNWSTSK